MKISEFNLNWLFRLGKVLFIFFSLALIPILWSWAASALWWSAPVSKIALLFTLYLFIGYLILVLIVKIVLYVVRNDSFIRSGFKKWHYFLLLLPVILSLLLAAIFGLIIEPNQEKKEREEIERNYSEAVVKVDRLREEFATCLEPYIEKKFQEELRSCNLLKNKIKHDYDFCVSFTSVTSPASCLYENDYQKIDCSEETMRRKAGLGVYLGSYSFTCQAISSEIDAANVAIEEYKNLQK